MDKVKAEQSRLECELDFVKSQQQELEEILQPLEASLQQDSANAPHDAERQHMYAHFYLIFFYHCLCTVCTWKMSTSILDSSVQIGFGNL